MDCSSRPPIALPPWYVPSNCCVSTRHTLTPPGRVIPNRKGPPVHRRLQHEGQLPRAPRAGGVPGDPALAGALRGAAGHHHQRRLRQSRLGGVSNRKLLGWPDYSGDIPYHTGAVAFPPAVAVAVAVAVYKHSVFLHCPLQQLNLNVLPCHLFPSPPAQGILAYFYHSVHPGESMELNRCEYNCMVDNPYWPKTTRCLDGNKTCQDCRLQEMQRVATAHFTICQKPWTCSFHNNPKNSVLCTQLHDQWFQIRDDFEKSLQIDPSYRIKRSRYKNSLGMCGGYGDKKYIPIPTHKAIVPGKKA